jgi:cytochrome c peroxidase
MGRYAVNAWNWIGVCLIVAAGCAKPAAGEKSTGSTSAETRSAAAEELQGATAATAIAKTDEGVQPDTAVYAMVEERVAADAGGHETKPLPTKEIAEGAEPAPTEEVLEEVLLGTDVLTQGIPGDGSLAAEDIKKWLDDPKNHVVLKPTLPQGLAAGAAQMADLADNPLTRAKIELGRQLYFDPRLSKDHSISCASCHHPENAFARATQFGEGVGGQKGKRNSPVAYNRILSSVQFWDGRAATLEEQALGPIANPIEMSNTHDVCVSHLGTIPGYKMQFEKIFPDGLTINNVAKAIASFERALVTGPSAWDFYEPLKNFEEAYASELEDLEVLKEDDPDMFEEYMALKKVSDEHPMSESAKRGAVLFFSDKGGCTACHVGANFTDEKYHNLGVGMDKPEPDLGRFVVTNDEKDKGAFKTPTVRNVELTGPYMHDGSQKTLEEVVEWYNKGGHKNQWLDEKIKPLNLSDQEKADLVAFMKALTGPLPKVQLARLPE